MPVNRKATKKPAAAKAKPLTKEKFLSLLDFVFQEAAAHQGQLPANECALSCKLLDAVKAEVMASYKLSYEGRQNTSHMQKLAAQVEHLEGEGWSFS
jgi:hypothetical protein